ncbi:MAG TPA: SMP-30/gluconolactonase/LRE family protein [Flavisolibacter sp.]|jgi:gluconolactonase|nr:SMP-30/gluconolactonase/LRE family protein [Flavisolibacter sp.]
MKRIQENRAVSGPVLGLLFILLFIVSHRAKAQSSPIYDTMQKPLLVLRQFRFTEGPAVDKAGNIYFTDQPDNAIWKWDTGGKLSLFLTAAGRSNGMFFNKKGELITCADEHNQLWAITPSGKAHVLLDDFEGHRFNGPNDIWIDKNDGMYFTDPYYQRPYWQRKKPDTLIRGQRLYYLAKGRKKAQLVDSMLVKPNGIVGNNRVLYVSDMGQQTIFSYAWGPGGKLKNKKAFVKDLADGMTMDERGNLYLAGNGITIYAPSGEKIGHIDIPEKWTANLCFGGKNRNLLFITASEGIYVLPMKVHGLR